MSSTVLLLIVMTVIMEIPVNYAHSAQNLWPKECKGRSYCHIQPSYYPNAKVRKLLDNVVVDYTLNELEKRVGADVGCNIINKMQKIYLIKDDNDTIRYVPQTDKFQIKVLIEECRNHGKVKDVAGLSRSKLRKTRVDCTENLVPFMFPVLTLNQTALESVAPKHGISLSCSAKVMEKQRLY